MTSERVLRMVKQLTEDPEYRHPRYLPYAFIERAVTLSNEEAMELAARLFMMDEWRYIWPATVIFKKHPTARTKIDWEYLEPLGNRMDSWGLVDAFSAIAGPAWRAGQLTDTRHYTLDTFEEPLGVAQGSAGLHRVSQQESPGRYRRHPADTHGLRSPGE